MKKKKKLFGIEKEVDYDPASGLVVSEGASVSSGIINLSIQLARKVVGYPRQSESWQILDETPELESLWQEFHGGEKPAPGGYQASEESEWTSSLPSFVTMLRHPAES